LISVIISAAALSFFVIYLINPLLGIAYFTVIRNVFGYLNYSGDVFNLSADSIVTLLIIFAGIFSFWKGVNYRSPSFLAFLLFIIVGAASVFVAQDYINFLKKLLRLIGYLFLYVIVQRLCIDKRSLRFLSIGIVLSIFVTLPPAIYYFSTHSDTAVALKGEIGKMGLLSKNNFGFYSAYMGIFMFYPLSYRLFPLMKPLAIIMLPAVISALILSYTRSAWVGFFVALIVLGLLSHMKKRIIIPLVIITLIIVAFSSILYKGLYKDPTQKREYGMSSWEYRTQLAWPASVKCIRERPIFGYGLGNNMYAMIEVAHFDNTSHNDYLLVTVETGFIGLISYLCLLVLMYKRTYGAFKIAEDAETKFFCLVTLGVFTTYIVGSFAEHLLQTPGATGYVVTMLAMAHGTSKYSNTEKNKNID